MKFVLYLSGFRACMHTLVMDIGVALVMETSSHFQGLFFIFRLQKLKLSSNYYELTIR